MLKRFLLLALVLTSTNGHVFAESGENEDPNPFRAPQAPLLPTRDDERKWAWDYIQGLSTLTTEQASRQFQEVLKEGNERKIMLRELEAMPYRFFCQLLHTDEYIGRNYRSVPPKEGLVGKLLAQLPQSFCGNTGMICAQWNITAPTTACAQTKRCRQWKK